MRIAVVATVGLLAAPAGAWAAPARGVVVSAPSASCKLRVAQLGAAHKSNEVSCYRAPGGVPSGLKLGSKVSFNANGSVASSVRRTGKAEDLLVRAKLILRSGKRRLRLGDGRLWGQSRGATSNRIGGRTFSVGEYKVGDAVYVELALTSKGKSESAELLEVFDAIGKVNYTSVTRGYVSLTLAWPLESKTGITNANNEGGAASWSAGDSNTSDFFKTLSAQVAKVKPGDRVRVSGYWTSNTDACAYDPEEECQPPDYGRSAALEGLTVLAPAGS